MNQELPYKILLIEDNPFDVKLFEEYLSRTENFNSELTVTNLFANALGYVAVNQFDLIILDLGLPDVIGNEGIEYLIKVMPKTPLVILTGCNDINTGKNAIQLGAQDYLVKGNFDVKLLEKSLSYAIERHKHFLEIKSINSQLISNISQLEMTNKALKNSQNSVNQCKSEIANLKLKLAS
jgi:DNA-binding NarL/FixJ family response regulator